jgi:hypothetical protein
VRRREKELSVAALSLFENFVGKKVKKGRKTAAAAARLYLFC